MQLPPAAARDVCFRKLRRQELLEKTADLPFAVD
jgi:hypothetical protein